MIHILMNNPEIIWELEVSPKSSKKDEIIVCMFLWWVFWYFRNIWSIFSDGWLTGISFHIPNLDLSSFPDWPARESVCSGGADSAFSPPRSQWLFSHLTKEKHSSHQILTSLVHGSGRSSPLLARPRILSNIGVTAEKVDDFNNWVRNPLASQVAYNS